MLLGAAPVPESVCVVVREAVPGSAREKEWEVQPVALRERDEVGRLQVPASP
ncbi:hypothetical protein GMLC_10250 [Geomonas limicola]|uniref:Uncharacterized protein n=1 Tax=Geomonas limicola TaxID=2740186 RepID=A0A6V8N4J8_9BACT|nr:hypothetical protein GMLC_10250 [Geomonas limicola]